MTRDEFEKALGYIQTGFHAEATKKQVIAEYDRLTTIIAQFTELASDFVAWNEIDLMALDALKDRARALIEEAK